MRLVLTTATQFIQVYHDAVFDKTFTVLKGRANGDTHRQIVDVRAPGGWPLVVDDGMAVVLLDARMLLL